MNEYFVTENEYLAKSLAYLGFKYYKRNNDSKIYYSFIKSEKLMDNVKTLSQLKTNNKQA